MDPKSDPTPAEVAMLRAVVGALKCAYIEGYPLHPDVRKALIALDALRALPARGAVADEGGTAGEAS